MTAAELNVEFEAYCKAEYGRWRSLPGNSVKWMPIWNPGLWFDHVQENSMRWKCHIDALAKQWWADRGYTYRHTGVGAFVEPLPR